MYLISPPNGYNPPVTRRSGFSMVEIMMAMGVLTLLLTVAVTHYSDMQADAQQKACLSELDAVKNDIQRYQLERRAEYTARTPPPAENLQDRRDPWFAAFRVDPARHLIWSIGPDGKDDQGGGDDVTTSYDAYAFAELHPPQGFRAIDQGPSWVELGWQPVKFQGGVQGYNVFRRESVAASDFSTRPINDALLPDSSEPKYRDEGLEPGKVYYYALEVVGRDGTRVTAPAPLGFQIPLTAPPRLTVTPAVVAVAPNQVVQFTIVAAGYGAPVRQIKFDGKTYDCDNSSKTLVISRSWNLPGTERLSAEAFDADNRRAVVDVQVTVK